MCPGLVGLVFVLVLVFVGPVLVNITALQLMLLFMSVYVWTRFTRYKICNLAITKA